MTGKPKPTGVLGTVNKPLSATGRKPYVRSAGTETGSNINASSELSPSAGNRSSREQSSEASETGVSENEENPVRIISVTPVKSIDTVKNKVNVITLFIVLRFPQGRAGEMARQLRTDWYFRESTFLSSMAADNVQESLLVLLSWPCAYSPVSTSPLRATDVCH